VKNIGYCPQFDALVPKMTAREHIRFYSLMRGIHLAEERESVIKWALSSMKLKPYADEISSSYSGGNKRKLSAAIALIGNPPLVLLV